MYFPGRGCVRCTLRTLYVYTTGGGTDRSMSLFSLLWTHHRVCSFGLKMRSVPSQGSWWPSSRIGRLGQATSQCRRRLRSYGKTLDCHVSLSSKTTQSMSYDVWCVRSSISGTAAAVNGPISDRRINAHAPQQQTDVTSSMTTTSYPPGQPASRQLPPTPPSVNRQTLQQQQQQQQQQVRPPVPPPRPPPQHQMSLPPYATDR